MEGGKKRGREETSEGRPSLSWHACSSGAGWGDQEPKRSPPPQRKREMKKEERGAWWWEEKREGAALCAGSACVQGKGRAGPLACCMCKALSINETGSTVAPSAIGAKREGGTRGEIAGRAKRDASRGMQWQKQGGARACVLWVCVLSALKKRAGWGFFGTIDGGPGKKKKERLFVCVLGSGGLHTSLSFC